MPTPDNANTILLVDDDPDFLYQQRVRLEAAGYRVIAAEGESKAEEIMEKETPNVAVVDLSLKHSNGLDLIKDAHLRRGDLPILVLSMRNESVYAERALRAGARGYITKDEATANVIEGIRKVFAGEIYLSRKMVGKVLRNIVPGSAPAAHATARLTAREMEVLERIGTGLTTAEIASALRLSAKTIETYRERIKQKLGLAGASELLRYAIEWVHSR